MQAQRAFADLSDEVKSDFLKLSTKLSPENLSCDGELTRAQTDAAYQRTMKQWRTLEAQHGVSVGDEEVMRWYSDRTRSHRYAPSL